MLVALVLSIAVGMVLVRVGWGGRRGAAALGWIIAATALAGMARLGGAWGLAVGCVAAITVALAFVLWAGWRSPPRAFRARRDAPSVSLPHRWRGLGRRIIVFALVVPVAAAAGFWLAFGLQAAERRLGTTEADATATLLLTFPVTWCALMAWQMTRARPRDMIASPAIAAAVGTILWIAR